MGIEYSLLTVCKTVIKVNSGGEVKPAGWRYWGEGDIDTELWVPLSNAVLSGDMKILSLLCNLR